LTEFLYLSPFAISFSPKYSSFFSKQEMIPQSLYAIFVAVGLPSQWRAGNGSPKRSGDTPVDSSADVGVALPYAPALAAPPSDAGAVTVRLEAGDDVVRLQSPKLDDFAPAGQPGRLYVSSYSLFRRATSRYAPKLDPASYVL
jgi:hypothetical protein